MGALGFVSRAPLSNNPNPFQYKIYKGIQSESKPPSQTTKLISSLDTSSQEVVQDFTDELLCLSGFMVCYRIKKNKQNLKPLKIHIYQ